MKTVPYPDVRCVFCGSGVVPLTLEIFGVVEWGCMACNSRRCPDVEVDGQQMAVYVEGGWSSRPVYKKHFHCPYGLLFVVEWEAL